jgi:hypothetical protein
MSHLKKLSAHLAVILASLLALAFLLPSTPGMAQTATATLQGSITDPTGAVIPQAQITITNTATGVARTEITDGSGVFTIVELSPSTYSLRVDHAGFESTTINGIVLSVGAHNQLPVQLKIGTSTQTVTVVAQQLLTTSAAVSTVVNQQEVANVPLNGRSFEDLELQVPGVTTPNPQAGQPQSKSSIGENGLSVISVNGNSDLSNSYTVDGVSADFGAGNNGGFSGAYGIGGAGGLPAGTSLGSTQALVPVDDLQEFRVLTSSYPAEYGSYAGGQFIYLTRSGTNAFHGSASDYLRNTVFDANDYFNNYYGIARQGLIQNDFAGTLGGPVWIPHLYDGRNKLFFYFDYEGLRAHFPTAASLNYVPDAAMRAAVTGPVAAAINAYPMPNGPDVGDGEGEYIAGFGSLNALNTYNLRLDAALSKHNALFVRVSNATSSIANQQMEATGYDSQDTRTYTIGLTSAFTPFITNEFRANFSESTGDQIGKITPPMNSSYDLLAASGYPDTLASYGGGIDYYPGIGGFWMSVWKGFNETRQFDLPDNLTWVHGGHQFTFGFDFRRLTTTNNPDSPTFYYLWDSESSLIANQPYEIINESENKTYPTYATFAAFAQDQWRVSPRLSLSYGLRWDVTPPPSQRHTGMPDTLINQNDLSELALGPAGAPYKSSYYDFGPRLGATYLVRAKPGYETQLRAGAGVVYDAADNQGDGLIGLSSPGFSGVNTFCPASYCNYDGQYSFPLPPQYSYTPVQNPPVPPFTSTYFAVAPHFTNPYDLQMNVALQQNVGANNALVVNYIGSFYRKGVSILDEYVYPYNPNFQFVEFAQNLLRSAYNAGQVVFDHRYSSGLYAYVGYTWAHDIGQNQLNAFTPYQKGNASGDLRNNLNATVTWDIPNGHPDNSVIKAITEKWGTDVRWSVRGGFPITLNGPETADAADDGQQVEPGLNFVPNEPLYLHGSYNGTRIPGGKQLNPAAFTAAAVGVNGDVPQNYFRGFGEDQWNVAIRRDFGVYENLHLQFRAESFNLFNHETFGAVEGYLPDTTFGQAINSLDSDLGGESSPQYQPGGPRELQFALKVLF